MTSKLNNVTAPARQYYAKHPLTSPSYMTVKIAAEAIRNSAASYLRGRMLDIGCGEKAKLLLLSDYVDYYVGLDHITTMHDHANIDIYGSAFEIPTVNNAFDSILCTAVLEHLETPQRAVCEAFRVLKEGGHAVYTVPLYWHLHEQPRDFFRYTKYGIEHLFRSAGFTVVEITALSGFLVTFGTEWSYYLRRFSKPWIRWLVQGTIALNNIVFPMLDRGMFRDERYTWMYIGVFKKPDVS